MAESTAQLPLQPWLARRGRPTASPGVPPFRSFWMGGFEGADHLDSRGRPLDMVRSNGHAEQLDADYARAAALGLCTLRESIGWRLTEVAPGRFDFDRLRTAAAAARRHGVQVLWSFMHYGTPPDVSLLDDALIERFVGYARAVAMVLAPLHDDPPVYNLINEIGFLAWAAGETPLMYPYRRDLVGRETASSQGNGYAIKRRLVRAVLAAIEAVREIDPRARFLHVEPVVHCVAPQGQPELAPLAAEVASYQWQAWDLIAGRAEPGLGGRPDALDLVGVNHYHSGQWEVGTELRLWWHRGDPRRRPLSELLADAWQRYRRPLVVAETGHVGSGRAAWLHDVAGEVERARAAGVPVGGLCLYPLVDRTDWEDARHWHRSGLWSVASPAHAAPGRRLLHVEYADALTAWQLRMARGRRDDDPCLLVLAERRWDGLCGRLQQLLPELARDWRVVVVEPPRDEPFDADDDPARFGPHLARSVRAPGLEVLVPRVPASANGPCAGTSAEQAAALLAEHLRREGIEDRVVWICDPSTLPLLGDLQAEALVYDCQADRSSAPAAAAREAAVLSMADLVLTAAPSLHERLSRHHANVHWVPDAVDADRFDIARADDSEEADSVQLLLAGIGRPRLGFLGRIDARLDLGLVAALAAQRPDAHVLMVGPIDAALREPLPQAANLHWLGAQPWACLPHVAAACDACLLPYRVSAHSAGVPGATLEMLAAGKPVVATALPDLARLFGGCLQVASDRAGFLAACTHALGETPQAKAQRLRQVRPMLGALSWRRQAERVQRLLAEVLEARRRPPYESAEAALGRKVRVAGAPSSSRK